MSARLRKQPEPLSSSSPSISEGHPAPAEAESRNINVNSRESTALTHIKDYASLVTNVVFHFPLYANIPLQFAINLNLPNSILKMFGGAKKAFNPEKDIPDLTGKVILVTGGNAGLGKCSVLEFVRHGAKVYMASRTESKARQSIEEIKSTVPSAQIEFLSLDLTSLSSIKHAADEFISKETQLHILLNNAGIMALPPSQTKDGFDIQWGTNHIGHALLTKLLLPTLLRTAQSSPPNSVRIVNLSSEGHRGARSGINFADTALATSSKWVRYGQSKLANILHAKALAKRYGNQGIVAVSCHPGVIFTSLYDPFTESLGVLGAVLMYPAKMFLASPEEGSLNQIALCTAEQVTVEQHGGKYFTPVLKLSEGSAYARDEELADKLWEYTEEVLREKGY